MEATTNQILKGFLTQVEIDDTHEKLAKLGIEGSIAREVAFDFMRLAVMANSFRFHKQDNLLDYCASAEQFLYQLKAVKQTHGFTNDRISAGIIWLKDNGFDYTYGGLNIGLVGKDAFEVLNKREEYIKIENAKSKPQNDSEKRGRKTDYQTNQLYSD